jgi:hypothetical protein
VIEVVLKSLLGRMTHADSISRNTVMRQMRQRLALSPAAVAYAGVRLENCEESLSGEPSSEQKTWVIAKVS